MPRTIDTLRAELSGAYAVRELGLDMDEFRAAAGRAKERHRVMAGRPELHPVLATLDADGRRAFVPS